MKGPALLALQHRMLGRLLGTAIVMAAFGSPVLQAERLPFQIYDASNGLAHDRIRCVLADSRGFLWFCTADGLSRFDGSRFVNYGLEHGLPHPEVNAIVEAGPGVYWVATEVGLARLGTDSDPSSEVRPDAANAVNASRQAPGTIPLTVYSPGSRRGSQSCVRVENRSCRPDVDWHRRRPVSPRAPPR